ncbi:MAG TPA: NAD(P)-dependent oxidoreductase [Victivallales bacterium]|nr:NAD(P)-dependent oxidoreductase [Victivallales bacterium]HPO89588.1 NAD(P)-dependent oxidoreductase [Victivallales bacterium]HRR06518.1 NAD(P)-dependent oxidoreductase [Victivallales bacterium]HRR28421.1 NAD(P)-dependent oxidoreductase [Victivallales bacterium]HRU00255.1 NAD(P)-dependent oxidoreductase [Victivallales bacterium]
MHLSHFPINIISRNKKCLIVGAGKIALRKMRKLFASDFYITVISPEIHLEIQKIATENPTKVELIERPFKDSDLTKEYFLVIAATDDKQLNKSIIHLAQKQHILCSSVDENWRESDFTIPASFSDQNITITVSSSGAVCRKSKMIKESLAKHLKTLSSSELFLIGTHITLLPEGKFGDILRKICERESVSAILSNIWGVHEFFILQTCNRIEMISVSSADNDGFKDILLRIFSFDKLPENCYYIKKSRDVFEHMALLFAGINSLSIGEKNIVSQIKNSLNFALEKGYAGGMIKELCDSALHISKHIRNETEKFFPSVEIYEHSYNSIKKIFPDLHGKNVTILGSGKTASSIALELLKERANVVMFYRNHRPEIEGIIFKKFPFSKDDIKNSDLIISAVNSTSFIIDESHIEYFDSGRKTILFDLGVPENISRKIVELNSSLTLFDIASLNIKNYFEPQKIENILTTAKKIVIEHGDLYNKLVRHFSES